MGYTMNPLAQALRTKTSTLVSVIVPDITNPFFAELTKTMTATARERGYQLVLCVTENDAGATAGYLQAMQSMYAPFGVIAPFKTVDPAEFVLWIRKPSGSHRPGRVQPPSAHSDRRQREGHPVGV